LGNNRIWLNYGVDANNKLVSIEDVARGKTSLVCPYCASVLIAKKGKVKEHHFSHSGETCNVVIKRELRDIPRLPLYDAFNIFLSGKELEQLKKLWHRHKSHENGIDHLEILPAFTRENLIETSPNVNVATGRKAYQFTNLGQIPVGVLPLSAFSNVQEPLIEQRLAHLEAAIFDNSGSVLPLEELRVRLTDLRIYFAAMRKMLLSNLYYLRVQADGKILYKIGVTTRSMSQRSAEIYRDLLIHYKVVAIEVLGTWASRANVERYFKYWYCDFNYPIGSLTEYFRFADKTQLVERDLNKLQAKVLSKVEQDIVDGKQDKFLAKLLANEQMKVGDVQVSNKLEANLRQRFLAQPSSQRVIAALHQGDHLRDAAAKASVLIEVARKVLAVMQKV
jgi:hypothetical protein